MASPRLCVMKKGESGYGFHLHGEKGKSGQYIRKVERASAAEASGLRAGDRVLEVNGVNVERETHHQVVQRIKAVEQETRLLVVDRETDELFRSLRLTSSRAPPSPASSSRAPPSPASSKRGEMIKPVRKAPSRAAKKEEVSAELLPRLCHLVRSHTGYGFNLHSERSRPGQYIRALDPDSPADRAGLKPQDRLIEVNGVNIEGMRHSEVVSFIKNGGAQTHLLVVDPDTDEHFKKIGIVPTSIHVKDFDESITNGSSSPHVNGSRAAHTDTQEAGLCLSSTAAEAKEKAHAKRSRRRAPPMDWSQKHQLFSNF